MFTTYRRSHGTPVPRSGRTRVARELPRVHGIYVAWLHGILSHNHTHKHKQPLALSQLRFFERPVFIHSPVVTA